MSRRSEYYLGARRKLYPVGSDCVLYHTYWRGDAVDNSIYGNNGTMVGASFGELGATLDGTDDVITVVPAASLSFGTGDFTLAMWFKYTETIGHGSTETFMSIWGQTPGWGGASLQVLGIDAAFDRPYSKVFDGAAYPYIAYENPGTIMETGSWFFFGYMVDRDVGAYAYCNGNVLLGPAGILHEDFSLASDHQVRIGSGNTVWEGGFVKGIIGEAYIFNTLKSDANLDEIFNFTKARYGL